MEYSLEQLNYFRICHVAFNLVPVGLRAIFKQEWDFLYSSTSYGKWQDTRFNGHMFYSKEKRCRWNIRYLNTISNGNTAEWDGSCLFFAILFSTSIGSTLGAKVRSGVDDLRQVRNDIAHISEAKLTDAEFQNYVSRIVYSFKLLGLPVSDIEVVKNQKSFPTEEVKDLEMEVTNLKTKLDQTNFNLETIKNTLQDVQYDLCSALEENKTLTQEINSKLQSFCSLTFTPPHQLIRRSNDVGKTTEKMEELYNSNIGAVSTVYLSGNPGSGKTQLARQLGEEFFCTRSRVDDGLTFVFTLNAESIETLADSYLTLCRHLGVTEYALTNLETKKRENPKETIQHIKRLILPKIKKFSKWLIIADNVVTLNVVLGFLPQAASTEWGHGQVLITTQDSSTVPPNSPYSYHESFSEGMAPDDAVQLLQQVSQIADQDEVEDVAEILEYQPLALAAAAYYVKTVAQHGSPNFKWSNYLEGLSRGQRETTENLLASESSAYSKTMTTAVKMAIETAFETDEVFQHLFSFLSLCSSELLPLSAAVKFIQARVQNQQPEELIKAKILRSSLVLMSVDEELGATYLRLHNIVQDVIKRRTNGNPNSNDKIQNMAAAMKIFNESLRLELKCENTARKGLTRVVLRILTSHCKALLENMSSHLTWSKKSCLKEMKEITAVITHDDVTIWLKSFARASEEICDFSLAKDLYEKALMIQEMITGEKHANVSTLYNHLGVVYMNIGEYNQAKKLIEKALMIHKKIFDTENADEATSYENLGLACWQTGEYSDAVQYHKKALTIRESIFGEEHADVARSYNNLGLVYWTTGEYTKAKQFHEKALVIRKKIFGEEHVDVATSNDNLGLVYWKIGKYTEAIRFYRKALMAYQKIFGEENGEVATSYDNLGVVYSKTGDLSTATEFYGKSLKIFRNNFSEEHADTAKTYDNLGVVYWKTGEYAEAEEFHNKALMIRKKIFGEEHADTATSYENLGLVYWRTREYTKAKELHEKALMIRTKIFGENHPDVATSYENLGVVFLGQRGRFLDEANVFLEKALMIRKMIFGEEHADVGTSYYNLGLVYEETREYTKAEEFHKKALSIFKKIFGEEHADVATSYYHLGLVYEGRPFYHEMGREFHHKAQRMYCKIFGDLSHIDSGASYHVLREILVTR